MNKKILSFSVLLLGGIPSVSTHADTLWLSAVDAAETSAQVALISARQGEEANGPRILQLQSFEEGPHRVSFKLTIRKPGVHRIWAATTPQTAGWASPFLILVNGAPLGGDVDRTMPLEQQRPAFGLANNPGLFQWYLFGEAKLAADTHQVDFVVNTRRSTEEPRGRAFAFYLDTLLVTDDRALVPAGADAKRGAAK